VATPSLGQVFGKSFEYYLYKTATGVEIDELEFWKSAE